MQYHQGGGPQTTIRHEENKGDSGLGHFEWNLANRAAEDQKMPTRKLLRHIVVFVRHLHTNALLHRLESVSLHAGFYILAMEVD